MQRFEARAAIECMEGEDFAPIKLRIKEKMGQKIKAVLSGGEKDERNRGWVEALQWVEHQPSYLREEIAKGVHDGEEEAPEE